MWGVEKLKQNCLHRKETSAFQCMETQNCCVSSCVDGIVRASYRYHGILSGFNMKIFSGGGHLFFYEDYNPAVLYKFKKENVEKNN
jgi:hypothetical protein